MPEYRYNYLLLFEFKGTDFIGWQRQPEGRTVYSEVEKAVKRMLGNDIRIIGASRTDSGVHALSYASNILANKKINLSKLKLALNSILPDDIAVKKISNADIDFNARFNAKHKIYEYRIWNKPDKNIWTRKYSWHIKKKLDITKIRRSIKYLLGKHDFSAFCGARGASKNKWVNLENISLRNKNSHLVLSFKADRFLNHMVRNLAGTLVDAGLGKIDPCNIPSILNSCKRTQAGQIAPSKGLFLVRVIY